MEERQPQHSHSTAERASKDSADPSHSVSAAHPLSSQINNRSPLSAIASSHLAPNTAHSPVSAFNLPNLPTARNSASSLMDAVFGDQPPISNTTAMPSKPSATPPKPSSSTTPTLPQPYIKRKPKESVSRTSSTRSQSVATTETESWDVLSDADSRLNEGEEEREVVVAELQKKVDRRKSQLPQLESQLADLEAQIKAAEERLAKAQVAQGSGIVTHQGV